MMENLVPVFIAVTAAAVVLQAGILVALYVGVRKTTAKLEATVEDLKGKAAPTIESAHSMLTELRPKVGQIVDTMVELRPKVGQIVDSAIELRPKVQAVFDNLVETTATVRSEVQRVDATVNDVMDRARLQVDSCRRNAHSHV